MAKNGNLTSIKALLDQGRQEEALKIVNQILAEQPDNLEAYYLRGLTFLNLGKYKEAIKDFRKRIQLGIEKKDYAEPSIFIDYGYCHLQLQEYDNAIGIFTNYIDYPFKMDDVNVADLTLAYKLRGQAYLLTGKKDQSIEDFETASDYSPTHYYTLIELLKLYTQFNLTTKAIEKLTSTIQLKSIPAAPLYLNRAKIYLENNNIKKGMADYQAFIKAMHDNIDQALDLPMLKDGTEILNFIKNKFQNLLKSKKLDENTKNKVLGYLKDYSGIVAFIEQESDNEEDQKIDQKELYLTFLTYQKTTAHFEKGITALENGLRELIENNVSEGNKFLTEAINEFTITNNNDGLAYRELGIAYFHLKNYQGAFFNFSLATELDDLCYIRRGISLFYIKSPVANDVLEAAFKFVLQNIYRKNNQVLPNEKQLSLENTKFIDQLIKQPEALDKYFLPNSISHYLIKNALECIKMMRIVQKDNNKINDAKSASTLPKTGHFKPTIPIKIPDEGPKIELSLQESKNLN